MPPRADAHPESLAGARRSHGTLADQDEGSERCEPRTVVKAIERVALRAGLRRVHAGDPDLHHLRASRVRCLPTTKVVTQRRIRGESANQKRDEYTYATITIANTDGTGDGGDERRVHRYRGRRGTLIRSPPLRGAALHTHRGTGTGDVHDRIRTRGGQRGYDLHVRARGRRSNRFRRMLGSGSSASPLAGRRHGRIDTTVRERRSRGHQGARAASVNPGAAFTYTVTVKNNGPSAATGVLLADTAPTGVTSEPSACCPSGRLHRAARPRQSPSLFLGWHPESGRP